MNMRYLNKTRIKKIKINVKKPTKSKYLKNSINI